MLARPYLLISFLPVYRDDAGQLWLELQWHRDFIVHLDYVRDLTLAAPVLPKPDGLKDLVRLDVPAGSRLRLCELPHQITTMGAVRTLPALTRALWRAVGNADIVHSNIAGWPYPLGWVANPIALLRKKHLVIVVESAPWRPTDDKMSFKGRLRHEITERLGRFFVNRADLSVFTHPGYRDSLFTKGRGKAIVVPASWVQDVDIISDAQASAIWEQKSMKPPRFLFAGRLVREKGVDVLLEVVDLLETRGVKAFIDIIGAGERRGACAAKAEAQRRNVELRLLDPVLYGEPFFSLLREYAGVIVPSLSDEQPRILFDSFSQGVPVIASSTVAHAAHVVDGVNGMLVPPGDARALADLLEAAIARPQGLMKLGRKALDSAREMTLHRHHEIRRDALLEHFGDRSSPRSAGVSG